MTTEAWRLETFEEIPEQRDNEAAWNMERDENLLHAVIASAAPPTVRLYQWRQPAITLGRFQDAERTLNLNICREEQIPFARRITGGRGILHGDDLTIAIASSFEVSGLEDDSSVIKIYLRFAAGFVQAFHSLGISASLGACGRDRAKATSGNCFESASRADIIETETGCKLLGAALHKKQEGFLLQASIPLYRQKDRFRSLAGRLFCGNLMTLPQAAEREIDAEGLKTAVIEGLSAVLQVSLLN